MLNKALRLVRVYHDLTQADVAERVGLSKSYVSEIESGDKNISLAVLEKYSTAFDIPMSSLMLFAEQINGGGKADAVRAYVADKALKMLDWVATISEYRSAGK
ncbi:helix-turn-helix transcriptional regulator [Paracoccus sp. DMF-8]|uniref:helix-turn-helix domain-containing protein n=1 Tax=Paracoccus sp. DMF-8 TaxID=3019445 RepID=UPI0023E82B99|nr:helix-turn-helix transcriptional regulator [Paracoccus sp. DMF-8]MDF3606704.1 helix-turn-helix transcriptional regulator [Paracoccus sp. DMF-8]